MASRAHWPTVKGAHNDGGLMAQEHDSNTGLIDRLNRGFAQIAGFCFDYRWFVTPAFIAVAFGLAALASGLEADASYESYFDEDDTTYLAYENYREDFGSDEVTYIGFELPGVEHGIWNVDAMAKLIALTEAIEDEVPFIYEVTTLANAELTIGTEDGIEVAKIADDWPLTQAELLERKDAYLAKPLLVGGIINEASDFAAIIIKMDRSSPDPPEELLAEEGQRPFPDDPSNFENLYPQVTDSKTWEILERPEYAAFEFYVSGDVPLNAYYNRILFVEPFLLLGIGVAVMSLILGIAFRSFVSVITPLIVMAMTLLATVALMAVLGYKAGLSFSSTPSFLLAIGVAHSVHILSEFGTRLREIGDRREALVSTIYLVGTPCLLTSVTTAVGFASMSFVPIKSIAQSAVYQSFGVFAAFVFSFTFLMALLSFDWTWPWNRFVTAVAPSRPALLIGLESPNYSAAPSKGGAWIRTTLDWITQVNLDHKKVLIGGFAVFLVIGAVGTSRVHVDSNWLDDFWPGSWLYEHTLRVDDKMGGTTNIIYLFDAGKEDAIKEPSVLREIERLQNRANEEDWLVRKTYSIVDIVKDLNQAFHANDPAYYRIPDTREEIAQYLILYESSGGEEAEEYVSSDYRHANLELRLRLAPTRQTADLVAMLDEFMLEEPMVETSLTLTGIGALWLILMDYIMSSQIQGFSIAFIVITSMMIAIFRSFRIGIISMVPNMAPVLLAMGAMGWFDLSLDYNKVAVAAIALGISVDDTIHLMTRFHHEFRIHKNYERALREAMNDVGRALIITSIALVLGFLVVIFSELRSEAYRGILLSAAIVTALVADFLFMPALVLWLKPFGPEEVSADSAGSMQLEEAV